MATTVHKNLTGSDLHEPKGADTALSGAVYVSNGAGSGTWTAASSVITNTAFTTGDLKPTHKVTADTSWIMWSDGTIGDGSSLAGIRANADTAALFALYWNNYSNTLCPVLPGGRGASAVADYAAHKTIALPLGAGRVFGLSGTGAGLTARTVGSTLGEETHLLLTTEIPSHTHVNTISDPGHVHNTAQLIAGGSYSNSSNNAGTPWYLGGGGTFTNTSSVAAGVAITNAAAGGGLVHNNMQPTSFVNVMIKL